MTAADDERALIARVLDGETAAVETLVDRHHASMSSVAGAIVSDPAQVADVVQESWIKVLRGLRAFEHRASLKTWILTITANTARTMATRLGRAPRPIDLGPDGEGDGAERFTPIGRWREAPGPEAALLQKELGAIVMRKLDTLPPLQRAVVLLRDVEELASDEIRGMLDIGEAHLRVLLHRGRARLRAAVDEELERS